jgi:plastocyanin
MKRTALFAFTLALLAIISTALLVEAEEGVANSQQGMAEVKIDNFSFGPNDLKVAAGTTVTWTNRDDIPHTVVSTDGAFKSKVVDTDEKFSFTFSKGGSYTYFCSIHPKMTGRIIVQ